MLGNGMRMTSVNGLSPVIIVPGDGSNQLEAKLDKPSVPHIFCEKKADWYRIWLNTADLIATTSCWADNIKLVVDATGASANAPGVMTRVPHWGSTAGLEELDPSLPAHASAAFYHVAEALVNTEGYARNVTLRGAPYDFRYTPDNDPSRAPDTYDVSLAKLIESTVAASGRKATLLSHSMGGLQTLYFLRNQPATWRETYVEKWVAVSTPFTGAAKEARLFATGDTEGLPVSASSIHNEQRSYQTNHWLFPTATKEWEGQVLARTDVANYTSNDTVDFFTAVGYPVGSIVQRRVRSLVDARQGPGVPVTCLYSKGVDTPLTFYYPGGDFSKTPQVTMGDGDGTVNERSLRICEDWAAMQPQPVTTRVLKGIDHSGMITKSEAVDAIVAAVMAA